MSSGLLDSGAVMNIDQILVKIGEFGRFQILMEAIQCFLQIPYTLMILLPYFTQDSPAWKCSTNSTKCNVTGELPSENKLRCSIPRSEWDYVLPKEYSIVTQFDLYCEKEAYSLLATSLVFVAWAIGSIVLGWISDRYGRWKVLVPSQVILVTVGLINAFSPNLTVYIITRFIIGFFIPGIMVSTFVLASEFVGPKYRPLAGILLWGFFALGLIILGTQAYFVRTWKILTIICTAPYIVTFPLLKFIPESVRWLRITDQNDKAMKVLRKIAKFNKKEFPEVSLKPVERQNENKHSSLIDIFRPLRMALKSIIQGYTWMVEGMVYYGVALAADDIGGTNRYANYILTSLVDFPAVLFGIYSCRRFGRKKTVAIPLFIGSILCIGAAFVPAKASATVSKHLPNFRVALGVFGKFFVATSFDSIYTWSVEIYPTVVRSEGMGFLQVMSRIGAALAPWATKWLIAYYAFLPFLLLGCSALLASITLYWLPETRDSATAEVFETAGKSKSELVECDQILDGENNVARA